MTTYEIPEPPFRLWSQEHEPVLAVADGDIVEFEVQDASGGVLDDARTGGPVPDLDLDRIYPLAGPVLVEGAQPGDVIELEPLEYVPGDWGWTASYPGLGLLPDDFGDPHLYRWTLDNQVSTDFYDVARIPVRPFLGVMGVMPQVDEPTLVMPPGRFGGNLDCRDLVVGSKLYLPVHLPGALLAFGDPTPPRATARSVCRPSRSARCAGASGCGCIGAERSRARSSRRPGRYARASATPVTTRRRVSHRTS